MQLILALIFGVFFWHSALAQQSYPLYPFQCPSGQFVYGFNPVTGGFPGWFCSTPAGGGGGGGLPSLSNGQILGNATGSQATAAATNLVGTGSVTISTNAGTITVNGTGGTNSLAPGLGLNLTTYNGTGAAQTFTSGATLFPQFGAYAITTTPYTLNATSGGTAPCSSGVLCDTSRILVANGSGSITFKAPNPSGSLSDYSFADRAGNGYVITTVSGSATFFGCGSGTSITVPADYITQIADWGANANQYFCAETPQNPFVLGTSGTNLTINSPIIAPNIPTQAHASGNACVGYNASTNAFYVSSTVTTC